MITNFVPKPSHASGSELVELSWEVPKERENEIANLRLVGADAVTNNLPLDSRSYITEKPLTTATTFLLIATDTNNKEHMLTTTVLVDNAKITVHNLTVTGSLNITG
ncbi:hypothetical protein ABZ611_30880 [Streptomyces sp. NPDC007861]|uniref:hypothetical protein n=1 Tax=Streptomyces sp. NPDC007861 TaxID=3154893 RepID=UPI0033D91271